MKNILLKMGLGVVSAMPDGPGTKDRSRERVPRVSPHHSPDPGAEQVGNRLGQMRTSRGRQGSDGHS